ncbi:MAG: hypothetical protein IKE36_03440 [Solobacterium sp.]|nr:hypothetical protein [Solobacterium sp.]
MSKSYEQKRVRISSKRQFTIPQKFFIELGFDKEAICSVKDGALIVIPSRYISSGEFAEEILSDLVREGFSGEELIKEFKSRQAQIRPAIESLLKSAKEAAEGNGEYYSYDDIFSSEED